MAEFSFNSDEVEDAPEYEQLPAGRYTMVVTDTDLLLTNKAKEANDPKLGQYIRVKFQVVSGQFQNRVVFLNFNMVNPTAKAVEIGHQQFRNLLESCGITKITDTSEIHQKVVVADLKNTPDNGYGVVIALNKFYACANATQEPAVESNAGSGPVAF